ncbi:MAG TPA: endonuclease/exonuclease/phosphatase family protein [Lacipirellulaceae bacterium]|nr:endonuclease/exonuclease/phosphatase family protein [Lacipirellulaceae bacterium]
MRTPMEGLVPRSYSALLIALIASGGWYFTTGPGAGKLGAILNSATQSQNGPAPAASPTAQGPQLAPDAAANVVAPAAPPQPMFGGPAIRIASFNIKDFGDAKAAKPYVMATLAAIIHNFHVVAIQEISSQDDYFIDNFLRNFVNQNGRVYDRIVGPRIGRSTNTEQYAFLYDTAAIEVNRRMVYTVHDPDDLLHREPLVAMFRVRGPPPQHAFTFVLVNIHTDPDETGIELDALAQVYQVVRRTAGGEDDIILLGDLNVDDQHLGQLGQLDAVRPVVRGVPTNTRGTALYDNIILHQPSTAEFSGRWGVLNFPHVFKLTPDQALQVSDHLPVWAEFGVYESTAPGRIATRPQATIRAQ